MSRKELSQILKARKTWLSSLPKNSNQMSDYPGAKKPVGPPTGPPPGFQQGFQQYPAQGMQQPYQNQQYNQYGQLPNQFPPNNQYGPPPSAPGMYGNQFSPQQYSTQQFQQQPYGNQQFPPQNQQYSNQIYGAPNQQFPPQNQPFPSQNPQYATPNQQYGQQQWPNQPPMPQQQWHSPQAPPSSAPGKSPNQPTNVPMHSPSPNPSMNSNGPQQQILNAPQQYQPPNGPGTPSFNPQNTAFMPVNNVSTFGFESAQSAYVPSMGLVETVDPTIAIAMELKQSVPSLKDAPPANAKREVQDAWRRYLRNIQDCQNNHTRSIRDAQVQHQKAVRDAEYYSKHHQMGNVGSVLNGGKHGLATIGGLFNKVTNFKNERDHYNQMLSDAKLHYENAVEHAAQRLNDAVETANRNYDDVLWNLRD